MKIAWIGYNLNTQLHPDKARSSGDYVYGIGMWRVFLEAGNEVYLHTPFDVRSEKYYFSGEWKENPNLRFLDNPNFHYVPDQRKIDNNVDFIYIEGSATNLMYCDRYWGISNIIKCYSLLKTYNGIVLLNPGEVELEFVFFLELFHSMILEDYNISTVDILKDKKYVIMTRAFNYDRFMEFCNTYRNIYDILQPTIEFIPDATIPNLFLEQKIPKENPEYEFTYVGNKRLVCSSYRFNLVKEYFTQLPNAHIFGDWDKDDIPQNTATLHGKIAYGEVINVLNNSRYTLMFTDQQYEADNMRLVTNRLFEIIKSGCIPLIYHKIDVSHFISGFPKELYFKNITDINGIKSEINAKGYDYIKQLSAELNKMIDKFNNPAYLWKYFNRFYNTANCDIKKESEGYISRYRAHLEKTLFNVDTIKNYNDVLRILHIKELFKKRCNDKLETIPFTDKYIKYTDMKICHTCSIIMEDKERVRKCTNCGGLGKIKMGDSKLFAESLENIKQGINNYI